MIEIIEPATQDQLNATRALFKDFVAWHRRTHVEDLELIERYFDKAAFEAELIGLPGSYAPPRGKLLLASLDGAPAGCVALHDLGGNACEMKRMFVPDRFRGQSVGIALGTAIVEAGRKIGYEVMRLDTSHRQHAAMGLYRRLGFKQIEPYADLPSDLKNWLVFFELQYAK